MSTRPLVPPLALLLALASACGDDDGGDDLPPLEQGAWNRIATGGETTCAYGGEYAFWVWPGRSDALVVDFIGGGACWNALTCAFASALFVSDLDGFDPNAGGLFDMENPENPVGDFTHVLVPYCTGDVHWGDAAPDYGGGLTLQHRGAVNTRAVLDWIERRFDAPEIVLTTGCSAGGYGSVPWAGHLIRRYPDARHVQLSDSAAGIITPTFFMDSFPSWNALGAVPDWIDGFDPATLDELPDLYRALAGEYPNAEFAQFNTPFDAVQVGFWTAMGGTAAEGLTPEETWSLRMRESLASIDAPNFHTYLGGDVDGTAADEADDHCVIPSDDFYAREEDGVRLVDWVADLLAGADVTSPACDGCEVPTR